MKKLKKQLVVGTLVAVLMPLVAWAAEPVAEPPQLVVLAQGHLQLPVHVTWKKVKPRSRIIQYEFSIPVVGDDKIPGRMTIMAASGGLEANIARWVGQFQSSEGKPLGDDAKKVEKKTIDGLEVHLVDLAGDYQDKPGGPFGPSVNRPNYRMLAAIVPTEGRGTWFIKLYGPQKTISAAKKHFGEMVAGLVWKAE